MRTANRTSIQKRTIITVDSISVIIDRQRANIVDSNTSKSFYIPCNFNYYILTCCANINAAVVIHFISIIIFIFT